MVLSVIDAVVHPKWSSESKTSFTHYSDKNLEAYLMSTFNQTLAGSIDLNDGVELPKGESIDNYLRI